MARWLGTVVLLLVACDPEPADSPSDAATSAPSDAATSTPGATNTATLETARGDTSAHTFSSTSVSMTTSGSASASDAATDSDTGPARSEEGGPFADAGQSQAVSCDPRSLRCRRAEPTCEFGFAPRIVDGCYAECVAIDRCVCDGPEACPQSERHTCNNSRQRCTPYLN